MRGSNLAPGTIALEEDAPERKLSDAREVLLRLEGASVDANEEAQLDELERLLQRARVGMNDPPQRGPMRLDRRDKVRMRRSRMEEQREVEPGREAELRSEMSKLGRSIAEVQSVVVESTFPYGDDLSCSVLPAQIVLDESRHGSEIRRGSIGMSVKLASSTRMTSHGRHQPRCTPYQPVVSPQRQEETDSTTLRAGGLRSRRSTNLP